jgi:hypothetical protein
MAQWKLRDVGNCTIMPGAPLRQVRRHLVFHISTARWIFMSALAITGSLKPTAVGGGTEFLKGSHRIGDGRYLLKNLRGSRFNKEFSNETTLSLIHLVGQYL